MTLHYTMGTLVYCSHCSTNSTSYWPARSKVCPTTSPWYQT